MSAADVAATGEPIFRDERSNVIPGEVLLQLREEHAAGITKSIPRGPTRGHLEAGPSTFGLGSVDDVLASLKVTSIIRLHPPASKTAGTMAEATALASTFRVRFAARTDVVEATQRLNKLDAVEYAEPNRYRETCVVPNDPSFATQWGLTRIHCPAAWDRTTGSPNIVVAVIDTGVDLDHPELAALLVAGQDLVDLGANPIAPPGFHFEGDFVGRDNDPQDEVGHGTHVAGTIACASNNGTGVAGVTWGCHLMPVRVLARIVNNANANDVRGVGSSADIAAGIRWAVDHGARILSMSLGGPADTQVERDAVAYAIAHGAMVVAAMGNGFQQGNATSFPAAYPDVVAVGAISQTDQRAPFSQTGPHIDVVAPGVGVLSTVWDNGFATMSGTSMATPHVSGVAALVLSCNPSLTAAQAADIIRQTADALPAGGAHPNDEFGFGCVNAQAAVNRACPPRPTRTIRCASVAMIRCPSVATCPPPPSIAVRCPPSRTIARCPSVVTLCPSLAITTCPSRSIFNCPSIVIHNCPSLLICPSQPVITCPRPSLSLPCPSGPICGIGPEPDPRLRSPGGEMGNDQGGGLDWEAYDPYGMYYGDEDDEQ